MNINQLAKEVHDNAVAHGWWDKPPALPEALCLIHAELSEALEEYRNGAPLVYGTCALAEEDCQYMRQSGPTRGGGRGRSLQAGGDRRRAGRRPPPHSGPHGRPRRGRGRRGYGKAQIQPRAGVQTRRQNRMIAQGRPTAGGVTDRNPGGGGPHGKE